MRRTTRIAVAGALAAPLLVIGSAGVAFADSYVEEHQSAGPEGVTSSTVISETGMGTASDTAGYYQRNVTAGPEGVRTGMIATQAADTVPAPVIVVEDDDSLLDAFVLLDL